MKKIALIGSTGSIGKQVLNVVRRNANDFEIVALAGGDNASVFLEQVKEFNPRVATLKKEVEVSEFTSTNFYFGENAFINAIINEADIVVVALVGFKGIHAVLESINKGKTVALANKESLVVGGELVMSLAKEKGVEILPIDSEHSAIWQSLGLNMKKPFERLIITCSGGAFRDKDESEFDKLTAIDALKHPNWNMGAKITVDCATLVNKGFEVIEAKWLFNTDFDKISVLIHRESIVHSLVEYKDGSVVAQLGTPTMETPISLALSYPERIKCDLHRIDFKNLKKLTFDEYDEKKFPCLKLVVEAGKKGAIYPAIINGANEQAVKSFLDGEITYSKIYGALKYALENAPENYAPKNLTDLEQADAEGRRLAKEYIQKNI